MIRRAALAVSHKPAPPGADESAAPSKPARAVKPKAAAKNAAPAAPTPPAKPAPVVRGRSSYADRLHRDK
jgi:hypothetical protein